jgi:hypothetical protein
MSPFTPPKATAVEVVAAQPTEADRAALAHLRARDNKELAEVAYLVKVRFESMPTATAHGWALYVDGYRVPKYWAAKDGIYFKVFDPAFFAEHDGHTLRFSMDGTTFIDTGLKLEKPKPHAVPSAPPLPTQADVLK